MKTQDQDIYHGIALTQIVEHESFKALNRASAKYGHYLVNTDRQVFAKYRTHKKSPWQFTFQKDEIEALAAAINSGNKVFVCLVCGYHTVCALDQDEIQRLIDLSDATSQFIRVQVPKGCSCRVNGSNGTLSQKVPHSYFPSKLFA